jgi:hypothetical protein
MHTIFQYQEYVSEYLESVSNEGAEIYRAIHLLLG